ARRAGAQAPAELPHVKSFERRARRLGLGFAALFVLVAVRYAQLQLVNADEYAEISQSLRVKEESIPFRRGAIRDRHGSPLAEAERSFDLVFVAGYFLRGSVIGSLYRLSILIGRGTEDERTYPPSPVDRCLALRERDLAGHGPRGEAALRALKRAVATV